MKDETCIVMVLDGSGSMASIKDDTIGGINEFIKQQKAAGANCRLTLVQFNSDGIKPIHESLPINEVPDLTEQTYKPRNNTPLLDAMGQTILRTGSALEAIPEENRPDKVVFVVITDGQENDSTQFTKAQINEMTALQENTYNWNFVYLGANQDAFAEAGGMGIARAAAANFSPDLIKSALGAASENIASYRGNMQKSSLNYSPTQRSRMMHSNKMTHK